MKLEDLQKVKQKLKKQKQKINKQIDLYDEKARVSKVNSFENKAINTLGFSLIIYLPFLLTSSLLVKNRK